jgi:hypothetical protein
MTPDSRKCEILGLVLNVLRVPQVEIKPAHIFCTTTKLLLWHVLLKSFLILYTGSNMGWN